MDEFAVDEAALEFISQHYDPEDYRTVIVSMEGPDADGSIGTVQVSSHPDDHPSIAMTALRMGYEVMEVGMREKYWDTEDIAPAFEDDRELIIGDKTTWPSQVFQSVISKLDVLCAHAPDTTYVLIVSRGDEMFVNGRGDKDELVALARRAADQLEQASDEELADD
jgi:hypothetical protein